MPIVAGIDFGTLSVRVTLFDSGRGRLGSATAPYPLHRPAGDPDHSSQSHRDHMQALVTAIREVLATSAVNGHDVVAIAVATTGSTVVPLDAQLEPLDEYYLWCDHRGKHEAEEITRVARQENLPVLAWAGGSCNPEYAWPKLLHWLRHNSAKRERFATMLEHCDLTVAWLTGVTKPSQVKRSVCALGHKWMWNAALGGFPAEDFLVKVDPLFSGIAKKLESPVATSDTIAGHLCAEWAEKMGLRVGIPVPVGALDAHWDSLGAGIAEGDIVNVVGTSTCVMAIIREARPIAGVCGVVPGSVHPKYVGIEAGLSAVGDIFEAIARRANSTVKELSQGLENFRAGETGLLRMSWDNGDRNVLVNPNLGGVTLGWNLQHTAQDELFAAIEGTAFHTRIVLERLMQNGVPVNRVINGGGIPQKNEALNQIYANVFNKPVLVPSKEVTSLGSVIFAFMAAGVFSSVEEAQRKVCPPYRTVLPQPEAVAVYEKLFPLYRKLYFSMGQPKSEAIAMGDVLPLLRQISLSPTTVCD